MALPLTQWSVQIGSLGETVAGVADLEQQIGIILGSPPGCDPLRPTFALDLLSLIDRPVSQVRGEAIRRVRDALTLWMNGQIEILRCDLTPAPEGDGATWGVLDLDVRPVGDFGGSVALSLPIARTL